MTTAAWMQSITHESAGSARDTVNSGIMVHTHHAMHTTILTGMNGTVAPAVADELRRRGHVVIAWDRARVPPEDLSSSKAFIERVQPTAIVHCAMGDPAWSVNLARTCSDLDSRFLFTGSASVYGKHQSGPFTIDHDPEPDDAYGHYKLECERRILQANPRAHIVRLGWQIALRSGGNQMVDFLSRKQAEHGHIDASTEWFPACSFLHDTARVLADVLERFDPGTYLLDGNPGLDILQIATNLNHVMNAGWDIRATTEFRYNNMMRDQRLPSSMLRFE
jgi:dTDP-4-dehydrorhamnose reductase